MSGITLSKSEQAQTLILQCPTCASDAADTLGVAGNLNGVVDATVVMRCEDCSTVYMSPASAGGTGAPPRLPASLLSRRRIDRWTSGLPPAARVLCVDCAAGEHLRLLSKAGNADWVIEGTDLEQPTSGAGTAGGSIRHASAMDCDPGLGRFDLILLPHSLESARDPNALLGHMAALLTDGGRVVAIVSNAGSSCFAAFGGRHWSGYQFPMTRQHLTSKALQKLGENQGLRVRESSTLFVPQAWLSSIASWLRDWGAGNGVISLFTGRWLVPQAMTSILEGIASMRGRGSVLVAQLERK